MRHSRQTSAGCFGHAGFHLGARRGTSLSEVMVTVMLVGTTLGMLAPAIGKLHRLQEVATSAALRLHHVEVATHALRRDAAEATSCQVLSPRELEFYVAPGERVRYRDEGRGLERLVLRGDAPAEAADAAQALDRPGEIWSQLHLERVQVLESERIELRLTCAPDTDQPGAVQPLTIITRCPALQQPASSVAHAASTSIPAADAAPLAAREETP